MTEQTVVDRTLRIHAVLGKLEGPYATMEIVSDIAVPVMSQGKTVGFASVYKDTGAIVADISLDYATEERLVIETRSGKLFPRLDATLHFGGVYQWLDEGPVVSFSGTPSVTQLDVKRLVLHSTPSFTGQTPMGWVVLDRCF